MANRQLQPISQHRLIFTVHNGAVHLERRDRWQLVAGVRTKGLT